MAKISTYARDTSISGEDLLTGSNYIGVNNYQTNNFKIKDLTEYIEGQISVSPQNTTLKANGGIVVEVINSTDSLAIDLSATNITGQLANSDLVNSSITINSTIVPLGGSIDIPVGDITNVIAGTYLNGGGETGDVTLNHDTTSRSDTTASSTITSTFTAITSITSNATGHITSEETTTYTLPTDIYVDSAAVTGTTTKTITLGRTGGQSNVTADFTDNDNYADTLTITGDTTKTVTIGRTGSLVDLTADFDDNDTVPNDATITLSAGTYISGGGNFTTDQSSEGTITFNHDNTTRTDTTNTASPAHGGSFTAIDTITTNATGHITDVNTKTVTLPSDDNTTYTIEAIASTNDSIIRLVGSDSTTDDVKLIAGSNITLSTSEINDTITISSQAFGNVYTVNSEAAMIAATSQAGDLVIRTDISKTFIHNGGTTGTAADFTELQFSGINNIALTAGNGITLSRTSITNTDNDLTITNALATSTTQGGIELFSDTEQTVAANTVTAEVGRTYGIQLNSDDQAVVNVPWVNDNTQNTTTLSFVDSGNDIILRNTTGGAGSGDQDINIVAGSNITLTHTDANNITIASTYNNTFRTVEVDTNGDGSANETLGAAETLRFKKGTNVTLAESDGIITISSENTEYSAGSGLDLTGTTFSHADTSSQASVDNSGRTYIQDITLDTYGHVTGLTSATETVTNTNDIDYINAASFNTSDGILTLSGEGNAGATVDLDGRYLTSYTDTNYYLDGITQNGNTLTFSVNGTTNQTFTFGSNAFNSTAYLTAEADTLATVTGRNASTSTDTTFNSHLTIASAGHWLYIVPNAANTAPTHVHGMAMSWNYSGGSRESNIIFAAGSDANASEEADCQIRFQYKPVSGSISTVAKLWSGGNMNIGGYLTVQNGGNHITNARVGEWNTAYGWGNHASVGYLTDITTQTDPKYLRSNADDTSSGSLTVVSYKFNGNATNPTDTTATIYDQSSVGLTASAHNFSIRNYNGSSMVESARFTTSSLTVIGDVIAYGSPSDISLKENIKPIENALDKVEKLQGVTFDWKESDSILDIKEDIGFIAQDVQKVLPELVRENENGKLSLRHQGIIPVLLEAIKELSNRIKVLENGGTE